MNFKLNLNMNTVQVASELKVNFDGTGKFVVMKGTKRQPVGYYCVTGTSTVFARVSIR